MFRMKISQTHFLHRRQQNDKRTKKLKAPKLMNTKFIAWSVSLFIIFPTLCYGVYAIS